MKPSEIYRAAHDVILERGWNQGGYESDDGSVCLAGACNVVQWGTAEAVFLEDAAVMDFLVVTAGFDLGSGMKLAHVNDDHLQSTDDALDLLNRAEKLAEIAETS